MASSDTELMNVMNQLRQNGVTGNIFFVCPDRGDGTFDGMSPAFPFQTIAQALAVCVSYNNDAIICFTNNATDIDFNVAGVGQTIAVHGLTLVGIDSIGLNNSNVGATHVLRINAQRCRVTGFRFAPSVLNISLDLTALALYTEVYNNRFIASNVSINIDSVNNNIHDNHMVNTFGATPIGITVNNSYNNVHHNVIIGTDEAGSIGINMTIAATECAIHDNYIDGWVNGIFAAAGSFNVIFSNNRFRCYGVDSQLTIVNGVAAVTIHQFNGPCAGVQYHINCAYTLGPTGSFKAGAVPGSSLSVWVEEYSINDQNWRRITPDTGQYRIVTTDAIDVLTISDIATVDIFRLRAALRAVPVADIDLDVSMIVNPEV